MTSQNLRSTIDALGMLKAEIASLLADEAKLKASLGDLPPGAYDGDMYRLSISEGTRETLDMEAVRNHLSRQFIQAHTNVTETRTLRVAARKSRAA